MTLFDILLSNELQFFVVLPKKVSPCLQKMALRASGARTNLFLAMEHNVYFTVLIAKESERETEKEREQERNIIKFPQKSFYCPLDKKVHS